MRRAEILESRGPIVIESCEQIPSAPPEGAVVKTSFCGVCHSDLHFWDDEIKTAEGVIRPSKNPAYKFPIVLGHEISGVVHSVGKNVQDNFNVGDKVCVYPWIGCGNCEYCFSEESIFCKTNTTSLGCGTDGGYSEYVVVSETKFLVKIPSSFPMEIACMLPCSALTAYNAVSRVRPAIEKAIKRKGKASLLLVGAGGLGLWCIQMAKNFLPQGTHVISADISEEKLNIARNYGADDTLCWNSTLSEEGSKPLALGTIDASIDFVNSPSTARRAFNLLVKGGFMVLVGMFGGSFSLPLPVMPLKSITIQGIYVGTVGELREFVKLIVTKELKPPTINFCKLEEVADVLEKLRKGKINGRAVIKF